jgi:hypothetical protein
VLPDIFRIGYAQVNYDFVWSKDHNLFQKILIKAGEISEFAEGIRMTEDSYNDVKYLDKESQHRLAISTADRSNAQVVTVHYRHPL